MFSFVNRIPTDNRQVVIVYASDINMCWNAKFSDKNPDCKVMSDEAADIL